MDDSRTQNAEAAYHAAHAAFRAVPPSDRDALRLAFEQRERARSRWLAELNAAVDTAQDAAALEDALAAGDRALAVLRSHGELPPLVEDAVPVEVSLGEAVLARVDDIARRRGTTRDALLASLVALGIDYEEDRAPASSVRARQNAPTPSLRPRRSTMDWDQHGQVFEREREAMANDVLATCVPLVNAWIERHRDEHAGEAPIVVDELALTPAGPERARSWVAHVTRRSLEDIGAGTSDPSPIDAALRFRCWLEGELAGG